MNNMIELYGPAQKTLDILITNMLINFFKKQILSKKENSIV